jgi:hypothetical protein
MMERREQHHIIQQYTLENPHNALSTRTLLFMCFAAHRAGFRFASMHGSPTAGRGHYFAFRHHTLKRESSPTTSTMLTATLFRYASDITFDPESGLITSWSRLRTGMLKRVAC